jgi:hypothetical protein
MLATMMVTFWINTEAAIKALKATDSTSTRVDMARILIK